MEQPVRSTTTLKNKMPMLPCLISCVCGQFFSKLRKPNKSGPTLCLNSDLCPLTADVCFVACLRGLLFRHRTNRPWRVKSRAPSLLACQALEKLIVGGLIADVIAVIGSIDVVMGDVDR